MQVVFKMKVPRNSFKGFQRLIQREKGFTLLEVLLVLFCISVVLSVTFPVFVSRLDHSLYEQALEKLYMTMYEAQYLAKAQERRTTITIEKGNIVTVTADKIGIVSQWQLPQEMNINLKNLNNGIRYTEKGTISKTGTITIETPHWKRDYSINFTYGRMRAK